MSKGAPGVRYAEVERETKETRVRVVVDLDGGTHRDIRTGIGFLDHMMELMAFHGCFDVGIVADGDLTVDDHHTAEDVGIVLGMALREALEDSASIERYAHSLLPMDESLVMVAVDISGRGALYYEADFKREKIGDLSTENIREFFGALARHAGISLHIRVVTGSNEHHIAEAMFKGFGRALGQAVRKSERVGSTSTKGKID